ncbi:MAG: hypothetical protein AB1531_06045 [Chloroflexota bacterium]
MKNNRFLILAVVMLAVGLSAACISETPSGTPQPVGTTADVGGWKNAATTLKGYSMSIEVSGSVMSSGWLVTVLEVSSDTDGTRLDIQIQNTASGPGAIDLTKGPILIDQSGNEYLPAEVDLGMDDNIPLSSSGSLSASVTCKMSAPDEDGIQQADCDLIVTIKNGSALLAVGAGKTVNVTFIFPTPSESSDLEMEWLDRTRFAVP